jgi:hypothetical protein
MRGIGSWRQIRLGLALVVFVLTLAVLIGGQGLARNLGVDRPLAKELATVKGVKSFTLSHEGDGSSRLELTLDRVPDLEKTIGEAVGIVEARQKEKITSIVIKDRRQGLEHIYYNLRFNLEEAYATGRYVQLRDRLESLMRGEHLTKARIYLGTRFTFVQLEKGRAYLYEVLPRSVEPSGVSRSGEGVM